MGMNLLYYQGTSSEARVPAASDQDFRVTNADATTRIHYDINENHYSNILVRGTIKIHGHTTPVAQDLSFRVVIGDAALTAGQTANAKTFVFPQLAVVGDHFMTVSHIAEQNAKDDAFIEFLTTGVDADTDLTLQNFEVWGLD